MLVLFARASCWDWGLIWLAASSGLARRRRRLGQGIQRRPAPVFKLRWKCARVERTQVGDGDAGTPRSRGVDGKRWNGPRRLDALFQASEGTGDVPWIVSRDPDAVEECPAAFERLPRLTEWVLQRVRGEGAPMPAPPRLLPRMIQRQKCRESFCTGVVRVLKNCSALRAGVRGHAALDTLSSKPVSLSDR